MGEDMYIDMELGKSDSVLALTSIPMTQNCG